MQRVVGGRFRGRKLLPLPRGISGVRPTGARVREAIFSRLQHDIGGARVLDLFAGSGALAIEALSRGAARVVCVERQRGLARHLEKQLATLELSAVSTVHQLDAAAYVGRGDGPFDLVFFDPPYADSAALVAALAPALRARLSAGAIVVHEWSSASGAAARWPEDYVSERRKRYGQTSVDFLRYATPEPAAT